MYCSLITGKIRLESKFWYRYYMKIYVGIIYFVLFIGSVYIDYIVCRLTSIYTDALNKHKTLTFSLENISCNFANPNVFHANFPLSNKTATFHQTIPKFTNNTNHQRTNEPELKSTQDMPPRWAQPSCNIIFHKSIFIVQSKSCYGKPSYLYKNCREKSGNSK